MGPKPLTSLELMINTTQKPALEQTPMHTVIVSDRNRCSVMSLHSNRLEGRRNPAWSTNKEGIFRQVTFSFSYVRYVYKLQERHWRYFCRSVYWDITVTKWHLWPSCRHPNHHRYMSQVSQQYSSTGNIERSYPGDRSTGFGQSCSWAMPMRSKIEGKKAETIFETENWGTGRGAGALGSLAGSLLTTGWKRDLLLLLGRTPYTLFLLTVPAMLSLQDHD